MQITAIKPSLHDQNRVNVFVDGRYAFSLDLAQVVDLKIKLGRQVSEEELAEFKAASEFGKLYTSTLEWVLTRPHSVQETREHLNQRLKKRELENRKRRQNRERLKTDSEFRKLVQTRQLKVPLKEIALFSQDDIERVISRLLAKGHLNDTTFARFYIENRRVKKGISRRQLTQELIRKGIERELIDELLAASPRRDEEEIQKLIQKKAAKKTSEQLLRMLVSRGFAYDLAKRCLEEYKNSQSL